MELFHRSVSKIQPKSSLTESSTKMYKKYGLSTHLECTSEVQIKWEKSSLNGYMWISDQQREWNSTVSHHNKQSKQLNLLKDILLHYIQISTYFPGWLCFPCISPNLHFKKCLVHHLHFSVLRRHRSTASTWAISPRVGLATVGFTQRPEARMAHQKIISSGGSGGWVPPGMFKNLVNNGI